MSNLKYELNKHKNKIAIGLSVVMLGAISFGVYKFVTSDKEKPTVEENFKDEGQKLAKYLLSAGLEGQINLLEVSNGEVKSSLKIGDKNNIYAKSNNLDKIMVYSGNTFYEVLETNDEIVKNEIGKIEGAINGFKFSDNYIVALKDKEIVTVSLKDKSVTNFPIKNIDSYIVYKDLLIYSSGKELTLFDIKANTSKVLDFGEKTTHFNILEDNSIIAFNEFGKGMDKYSFLKINPETRSVEKGVQHHNSDVMPVMNDSDDKEIFFIDTVDKNNLKVNSLNKMNISSKKNEKNRITLPTNQNIKESKEVVSTKGYMYSLSEGQIEVFDQRAESVKTTISTDSKFFMPILK